MPWTCGTVLHQMANWKELIKGLMPWLIEYVGHDFGSELSGLVSKRNGYYLAYAYRY